MFKLVSGMITGMTQNAKNHFGGISLVLLLSADDVPLFAVLGHDLQCAQEQVALVLFFLVLTCGHKLRLHIKWWCGLSPKERARAP